VTVANTGSNAIATVLAGDQTKETNVYTQPAGRAKAFQYTASTTGTVTEVQVYLDGTNQATQVQVGLYGNSGGTPGTLVTQGTINVPVSRVQQSIYDRIALATS
jgi:hypothetical protein